jgi:hypothetical protein
MPGNIGSVINNSSFTNGKERALDIVRGSNLTFNNCKFSNGTDRKATSSKWKLSKTCDIGIKGGFDTAEFNDCELLDAIFNVDPSTPEKRFKEGIRLISGCSIIRSHRSVRLSKLIQ